MGEQQHGVLDRSAGLYRYPVKSLGGEPIAEVDVTAVGPVGDRNWAVIDETQNVIRSAKQWPALLGSRRSTWPSQFPTPTTSGSPRSAPCAGRHVVLQRFG